MRDSKLKRARRRQRLRMLRLGTLLSGGLVALTGVVMLISGCASKPVAATPGADGVQVVKVLVKHGYSPSAIVAKAGQPLKIEFYRDEEPGAESCDKDLVIPSESVNIPLPPREAQIVEIKPQAPGSEVEFQCGMNMMRGKISFK
jgi:plastocyanin domain-containing protein